MAITLTGDCGAVQAGMNNLLATYPFAAANFNKEIFVRPATEKNAPSLTITPCEKGFAVDYCRPCDFFRAVGCILAGEADQSPISETAVWQKSGAMIDLSRDAVYTVAQLKEFISWLALSGLNTCYLYMEDTYQLEKYPYFGYMRGAYSMAELKQLDDFADSLGIELIPCIQTLAHLTTTLQWDYSIPMRDTQNTLLVGSDATYAFIREMFTQLKKVFRTRRIHIGMDEAMDLGTGARLRKQGYTPPFDLMLEHLNKVTEIAKEEGLTPIIWDDMFYRAKSEKQDYYDPAIDMQPEDIARVPKNVQLSYWDYYHDNQEEYECFFKKRQAFPYFIFAGGIWKWNGWVPNYGKTFVSTRAALEAAHKVRVDEVLATMWGDDGAETPLQTVWPGLILFGQYTYNAAADDEAISNRCQQFTGCSLDDFRTVEELDLPPKCKRPNTAIRNPSKYLLYQDLMLGAFDLYTDDPELSEHYRQLAPKLAQLSRKADLAPGFDRMLYMYSCLSSVLAQKVYFGNALRKAYKARDKAMLGELLAGLDELEELVCALHEAYSLFWCYGTKGTGLEVHDIRLGGITGRIRTVRMRLGMYLDGSLDCLDELEGELLPYDLQKLGDEPFPVCNRYNLIATQNVL